ncbi:uncharacterized protein Z518_09377 [Rhinocladiella mackenziei CBS 650.93]|uniref:GPI anchored protein n=1 Tax=Rhinocladiella mackenziei CBS 650.93 TaxID=1442369 RepID=A0A0D2IEH4_9EURO|nr:uncharacterized protein Z518_09377 [Rhinocladiella mackenziei CBS 650.93]KIX01651.1 hypothetical protein Z518_09377 [Rhinocladiella mackenziei CBS 650.93]
MRFLYAAVAALCAVVVSAQENNAISIPAGQSTLDVTAGSPLTIEWTNPSSGTVTIKLQQEPITPESGITLASGILASTGTATVQIPPADEVNSFQYTIEIIDDTDPSNINFSPNFGIQGATGTQTGSSSTASSTGTASTGSITSTATNSTITGSTESTTATTTTDSSSTSGTSSESSATTASSETTSESSSSTTSAAAATETTSAPDSNENMASSLKVQGSFLAMAVGLIAVL